MAARPVLTDAFERVASTFVVTVLTLATTNGLNIQDYLSLDTWKGWLFAGVAAALTVVKTLVAATIARRNGEASSASLAPSVVLEPVGAAV